MAETTAKRTRKPRRNFARDWENLETYIRTVIRIKSEPEDVQPAPSLHVQGQVKAYKDVLDMMQGGTK